jgi:hypothetical protein
MYRSSSPARSVIVGVMKEYIANIPPKPTTPTRRASPTCGRAQRTQLGAHRLVAARLLVWREETDCEDREGRDDALAGFTSVTTPSLR